MTEAPFTFHLLSDLHIEFSPYKLVPPPPLCPPCDALILAGDIGNPWSSEYGEFVRLAAAHYSYVFLIKGNHECFGHTLEEVSHQIRSVVISANANANNNNNIIFLDSDVFDIRDTDIRIAGTTLWSEVEDDQRSDVQHSIADYRLIRGWSVEHNNYHHASAVAFLEKEMQQARADGKRLVVITHHAPALCGTGRAEHEGSRLSSAFASDLTGTLLQPPVVAWAFGHTHHSTIQIVNGIKLASNQRGYQISGRAPERTGFNPTFTFSISCRRFALDNKAQTDV